MTLANTFNVKLGVALTTTDTTMQVQSGFSDICTEITNGAQVYLRITSAADSTVSEVVVAHACDAVGNSLSILRGGSGTTAIAHAVGDCVTIQQVVNQAKAGCCDTCGAEDCTTCDCASPCGELVAACQVTYDSSSVNDIDATNVQDALTELANEKLNIASLSTVDFSIAGDGTVTANFPDVSSFLTADDIPNQTQTVTSASNQGTGTFIFDEQVGQNLIFNTITGEAPMETFISQGTVNIRIDIAALAVALVNDSTALAVLQDALGTNPIATPPNIQFSNTMPEVRPGEFYTYTLTNTGGPVTTGSVTGAPAGLTFNTSTLTLSGTYTGADATGVTIQFDVSNTAGSSQYIDTVNLTTRTVAFNLTTTTHSATNNDPVNQIEVLMDQNGQLSIFGDGINISNWISPVDANVGVSYEVRLLVASGSSPTAGQDGGGATTSSAVGTWLQLNSQRRWYLLPSVGNTLTAQWTLEIGQSGANTAVDSVTLDLSSTLTT